MNSLNQIVGDKIEFHKNAISKETLETHFEMSPVFKMKYTQREKALYIQDSDYKLSYLSEAIRLSQPELFTEYMRWAKVFYTSLKIVDKEFFVYLDILKSKLKILFNEDEFILLSEYFEDGLSAFNESLHSDFSYLDIDNPHLSNAEEYLELLLRGDRRTALNNTLALYHSGVSIKEIYLNIFQPVLREVGLLWQKGKITVAHEHFVTAATQLIMSQLYPFMFKYDNRINKNIVVTCVSNELHEIGARMVADFFEMEGWDSYYFGANTPIQSVMSALQIHKADVLAVSATMTYHIRDVENFISTIKSSNNFTNLKIIVGGYPFKLAKNLWAQVGADGCAMDAKGAIDLANSLISANEKV
jgi:methanogenic corrinoid protein MtbC1